MQTTKKSMASLTAVAAAALLLVACGGGGGGTPAAGSGGKPLTTGQGSDSGKTPSTGAGGTAFGLVSSCKEVNGTVAGANPSDKTHFDCLKGTYSGKEHETGKACKLVFNGPDKEVVYEVGGKTYRFDPAKKAATHIVPGPEYFFNHTPPKQGYDTRLLVANMSVTIPAANQQDEDDTYSVSFHFAGKMLPTTGNKGRQRVVFEKNTVYTPSATQEEVDSTCVIAAS